MDQTELLWAMLIAGRLDAIKNLDPVSIDFSRLCRLESRHGRTLLVEAVNMLLPTTDIDGDVTKARLDCITRLISWGASPWQTCSNSKCTVTIWAQKEGTEIEVDPSKHSAISYVQEWLVKLENKPLWVKTFVALGRVLDRFATAVPREKVTRVSIHEGIAELWERYLAAKASHDLTFKTADGEVTAHVQMLKEASLVVSAMLASPMKEGQDRTIEVKDTNSSSVSLFLERLVCMFKVFLIMIKLYKLFFALSMIFTDFSMYIKGFC